MNYSGDTENITFAVSMTFTFTFTIKLVTLPVDSSEFHTYGDSWKKTTSHGDSKTTYHM